MRSLVYLVATSVDGRIADADGSAEAFPVDPGTLAAIFARYPETCPAHLRDALGVTAPPARFDAVVLGARTHAPAIEAGLTSAYPHLSQHVVTHATDLPDDPSVTLVRDPVAHVRALKQQEGRDIWLCGGGDLAAQLADEIDELVVKVNPLVLGDGVPLVRGLPAPLRLALVAAEALPGDVVLLHYRRA